MRQNNLEKIYQAAIHQNADLLPTGSYCIDEHAEGQYEYSAISRCAQENNRDAVEWLLNRCAQINFAAYGAALGGHQTYAEELLKQSADINQVAAGAALGGHKNYAEKLLGLGADINWVARGAAMGGHQAYADALLARGADIDTIARAAALGGHQAYADVLLGRGADINWVSKGATEGGYHAYVKELLERGASAEDVGITACLCGHPNYVEELLTRQHPALVRTDISLYYLLLLSSMHETHRGNLKKLPSDMMLLICSFVTSSWLSSDVMRFVDSFLMPSSLSTGDLSDLGMQAFKGLLVGSLVRYQQSDWSFHTRHRKRASSFKNALARTSKLTEMVLLVGKQFSLLSGDNPYPQDQQHEKYQTSTVSNTSDCFFKIVSRWHGRFNGPIEQQKTEVALEYKSEAGEESHCEATQEDPSTIVGACVGACVVS